MTYEQKEPLNQFRWRVHWIDGDGKDHWQLIVNKDTKYFDNEKDAQDFISEKIIKSKESWWQPSVSKEQKIKVTKVFEVWERAK